MKISKYDHELLTKTAKDAVAFLAANANTGYALAGQYVGNLGKVHPDTVLGKDVARISTLIEGIAGENVDEVIKALTAPSTRIEWSTEPEEDILRVKFNTLTLAECQKVQNLVENVGLNTDHRNGYEIECNGTCSKGPKGTWWSVVLEFEEPTFFTEFVAAAKVQFGEPREILYKPGPYSRMYE